MLGTITTEDILVLKMAEVDRVAIPSTVPNAAAANASVETETPQAPGNANTGDRRPNIMTGKLPDDFLRIEPTATVQGVAPVQTVINTGGQFIPSFYQQGGILTITIAQARLAKNYGLSRMDPYCRLRAGNAVFETPTAYNGAKNPRWNKSFQIPLPYGVNRLYLEIFDECSFSPDERIAWGLVVIKDEILAGETVDDWYSLSGKQGDDKEGMINIMMHYREGPLPAPAPVFMQPAPMVMAYGTPMAYGYPPQPLIVTQQSGAPPVQQQQRQPQPQQQATYTEQDFKTVKDMFPDMDDEIIKSVLLSSGGNVDTAVNHLLSMTT